MSELPNQKVAAALVKAQKAFKPIKKTKTAKIVSAKGSYSFKYADLADVLDAVIAALNANGIALTQRTKIVWESGNANMVIVTELLHESGETISGEWPLAMQQMPQQTGILLSYYRRYAATAILGVASETDTDKTEGDESETVQGDKPVKKHKGQTPVTGKHTQSDLKAWVQGFSRDLHACSDVSELDALVTSSQDMITEVQNNLSAWWYGHEKNPDYEPLPQLIQRLHKELEKDGADIPSLM
jgi:hypothetical protein